MPAVIVPEGAHHLDLRESNPADPEGVIEARKMEVAYITQWLNELQFNKKQHSDLKLKKFVR